MHPAAQPLQQIFGFDQFRPGQQQTIEQLLAGQSSLAIFPTGSGKSLCYQLTATLLPQLTLVVSPLLALMKDQLEFLAARGIAAASIDSSLTPQQNRQVMADVREGRTKILMVSVERFKNERFRQFIDSVAISMLVVDEAHCISEWGHNFRPDYLKLPHYRRQLNIPLVLLLTATATAKVKRDMAEKFAIEPQHIVQTGFYRGNLELSVQACPQREKDAQLIALLQQRTGAAIVYVTLQHSAEQVANMLSRAGLSAAAYHAGFDSERRQQIQSDFMSGRVQIIAATIAFGMGIDKADIRTVIHYDLPKSIENYSQEIGRAGRDNQPSKCITLANLDGLNTVENFVYGDTPELTGIEYLLGEIAQHSGDGRWELQLVALSNDSNIRQLPLKTLLVQLELRAAIKPLYAYFAEFNYKFLQPKEIVLDKFSGERRQFIAALFEHSHFKKVWGQADLDSLQQHYPCDRARAINALEYLQQQQLIELQSKGMTEVFEVDRQALQQPALAQTLHQYFVDKEHKEIARIQQLIRFFELDRCLSHNLARYFDDRQAPEHCGHCSVCRGQAAQLPLAHPQAWPDEAQLRHYLSGLRQAIEQKTGQVVSSESCCKFLAGLSCPLFTRHRVRQLPGFGSCGQQRYGEIRERLTLLT